MDSLTLRANLRQLGKDANALTDNRLNQGGCAVYAALVGRELERLGVPVLGIVCETFADTTVAFASLRVKDRTSTRAWNRAGIHFDHVGLEFECSDGRYVYDSDTLRKAPAKTLSGMPISPGYLSVADVEALAGINRRTETRRNAAWNSAFSRKDIPALRDLVAEYFVWLY